MLVKNWMSKNVITVDENDSMQDAMKHLKEHDIRMCTFACAASNVLNFKS